MSDLLPSWITAIAAIIALFVGIPAWLASRRSFKREMVSDLFKEYSAADMGLALALIHKEFRRATGLENYNNYEEGVHRDRWVEHYVRLYREGSFELHWARRRASQFFQRIVYAADGDATATKIAKGMWGATENFMVLRILLPIENIAMPRILNERPRITVSEYNPAMKLMRHFWSSSVEKSDTYGLTAAAIGAIVLACALSVALAFSL